jgi:hypothetical protein
MPDRHFYDLKNEGCQNANTGLQRALYGAQNGRIFRNWVYYGLGFAGVVKMGGMFGCRKGFFSGIFRNLRELFLKRPVTSLNFFWNLRQSCRTFPE